MRTRRSQSSGELVPSSPVSQEPATHQPVLLHEAIENLAIQPDDIVVDATLGGAGHAGEIAARLSSKGTLIGFDLDHDAIARAQKALAHSKPRTYLIESNFRHVGAELSKIGMSQVSKALFDLGWSSFQLEAGRGFSFQKDEPLLMTYTKDSAASLVTAARIVNEWEESSIADVLYGWGEERYARRIAKKIVETRATNPFSTSRQLADVIKAAVPAIYRFGRIHPATKTFQALRIAVNDELGSLERALQDTWHHLKPGGRIAVISFHSIEDRLVKQRFVQWESEGGATRITKKPIRPGEKEVRINPRSRSAKLRVIQKNF
jgi:16S rRNA (cytosine1402-N4)-methyltransferase